MPLSIVRLNPVFLDWQSNPNQSQICDWQSKSKSDFQNWLTIQSKSNHNPTFFWKKIRTADIKWPSFMMQSCNSQYTTLTYQLTPYQYWLINCLKILKKVAWLQYWSIIHYEILISWWNNLMYWIWIEMTKLDFDFGLSITIQSTKLNCNPDWAIQQSNPAIPCQ